MRLAIAVEILCLAVCTCRFFAVAQVCRRRAKT